LYSPRILYDSERIKCINNFVKYGFIRIIRKLLKYVFYIAGAMAVTIDKEKCTACGACVDVCPVDALKLEDTAVVDEETCIDCGTCVDECPVDAISL